MPIPPVKAVDPTPLVDDHRTPNQGQEDLDEAAAQFAAACAEAMANEPADDPDDPEVDGSPLALAQAGRLGAQPIPWPLEGAQPSRAMLNILI